MLNREEWLGTLLSCCLILLGSVGPGVKDFHSAVGPDGQLEVVAGVRASRVGDEEFSRVVGRTALLSEVELP